mgnify:CR=1 FL=1
MVPVAVLAAISAYYRWRPLPAGINGRLRSYRVPAEDIRFFHNTTWYENGQRWTVHQITPELLRLIEGAQRWVVADIFLFSHHHIDRARDYLPTTGWVAEAVAARERPVWFITDPINTSYGSWVSPPLRWLERAGARVCITDLNKLRDNNLLYSPFWRLLFRWMDKSWPPKIGNLLEPGATMSLWSLLDAINARGNHRKLLICDQGDSYVTLITSANFEDASSHFGNTAVTIRSAAVARHFLEAEKAIARVSGLDIPVTIADAESEGDAVVTPLMGADIKRALLCDLAAATPQDFLYLFAQFLSERRVIDALIAASRRGVPGVLVLDQNKVDFGNPKLGFPNQLAGPELARRTGFEIRWANIRREEYHNQFMLLCGPDRCILHVGSANYNRRSLSNTVLEANVRIDAPRQAEVSRKALSYAEWMASAPRSLPYHNGRRLRSLPKYLVYRFLEATGCGTF